MGERIVFELARLGDSGSWSILISTASTQVYPSLRVTVGNVERDRLVVEFPESRIPKTSLDE